MMKSEDYHGFGAKCVYPGSTRLEATVWGLSAGRPKAHIQQQRRMFEKEKMPGIMSSTIRYLFCLDHFTIMQVFFFFSFVQ